MPSPIRAVAYEAKLWLATGTDPRSPGAAVTASLCGHWEHSGRCRWPHHNEISATTVPATLRTVVVVDPRDRAEVLGRIEAALAGSAEWSAERGVTTTLTDSELRMAERLETSSSGDPPGGR